MQLLQSVKIDCLYAYSIWSFVIVVFHVPEMVAPTMQTGRVPARSTRRAVSGPEKKYIATCAGIAYCLRMLSTSDLLVENFAIFLGNFCYFILLKLLLFLGVNLLWLLHTGYNGKKCWFFKKCSKHLQSINLKMLWKKTKKRKYLLVVGMYSSYVNCYIP